jgi:hypothetical protein
MVEGLVHEYMTFLVKIFICPKCILKKGTIKLGGDYNQMFFWQGTSCTM